MPILAFRSAALAIPDDAFRTRSRELAVDRRDVLDRCSGCRRITLSRRDADVDLALADLRHEVRVDLVLERDSRPSSR
jgi:hypothetical protein